MKNTKLESALYAHSRGLSVFPLTWTDDKGGCSCGDPTCNKPGKHPIKDSNGFYDATYDESVILEQWKRTPDANIGIYPGASFVVVDLDRKKGKDGVAALVEHLGCEEIDLYESGFIVETPSSGLHLYFRTSEPFGSSVSTLPGVDVRAIGGYVLGAGSIIGDKTYKIIRADDFPPLPDNIKAILRKPRDKSADAQKPLFELDLDYSIESARGFLRNRKPAIEGHGGNNHTYVTANQLKDFGISEEKALSLMLEGWNEECSPPWPPAELGVVVRNAYSYGANRPGHKGSALMNMESILDAIDDAPAAEVSQPSTQTLPKFGPHSSFDIANGFEKVRAVVGVADHLIPGWLPGRGFAALLGKRGKGKTVELVDQALCFATDSQWNGKPTDSGRVVFFLAGEDEANTLNHIEAWCKRHGRRPAPGRFYFIPLIVNLMKAGEVTSLCDYIESVVGTHPGVAYVDTWQRATAGGKQTSDEDMQPAVHNIEAIGRAANGPAVGSCHPPANDDSKIMGSTVIENSTAAIWQLEPIGGNKTQMTATRVKGLADASPRVTVHETIELDRRDKFGNMETGRVALPAGAMQALSDMERNRLIAQAAVDLMDSEYPDIGNHDLALYTVAQMFEAAAQDSGYVDANGKGRDYVRKSKGRGKPVTVTAAQCQLAARIIAALRSRAGVLSFGVDTSLIMLDRLLAAGPVQLEGRVVTLSAGRSRSGPGSGKRVKVSRSYEPVTADAVGDDPTGAPAMAGDPAGGTGNGDDIPV